MAAAVLFDLDNTLLLEDAATRAAIDAAVRLGEAACDTAVSVIAERVMARAERLWLASPVFEYCDAIGIWWGEALWGGFAGEDDAMREMRAFVPGFRSAVWRGALDGCADHGGLARAMERRYIEARRSRELVDEAADAVLGILHRDHLLALLTNGAGDVQREKLARSGLAHHFDTVLVSAEIGAGKPDRRIFAAALDALGVAPPNATMVGDTLVRDVAGARAAGLRAVWLDRGLWDEGGPTPDARIERLSDLPAVLAELERRPASPRASS